MIWVLFQVLLQKPCFLENGPPRAMWSLTSFKSLPRHLGSSAHQHSTKGGPLLVSKELNVFYLYQKYFLRWQNRGSLVAPLKTNSLPINRVPNKSFTWKTHSLEMSLLRPSVRGSIWQCSMLSGNESRETGSVLGSPESKERAWSGLEKSHFLRQYELERIGCNSLFTVRIAGRYCFWVSLWASLSQFTDFFKKLRTNESLFRTSVSLQVKEDWNGYTLLKMQDLLVKTDINA